MPTNLDELRLANVKRSRALLEDLSELMKHPPESQRKLPNGLTEPNPVFSRALTNLLLQQIASGIADTGGLIAEQLCELREAVDRLCQRKEQS